MRFHKLRLITKDGGSNVFTTSSKLKRLFSIGTFVMYFAIVCYVLFQINHFPKIENGDWAQMMRVVWLALIVITCWIASRITNLNLHLSYATVFSSFGFAIIMSAYVIIFVVFNVDKQPQSWTDLFNQYYWWIPIIGWGAIWKLKFAILEYKARPYFAIKKLLNAIISLLIIGLIVFGVHLIDKFALDKQPFDYQEEFPSLVFIFIAVVLIFLFAAAELFYFNKFGKSEVRIKKVLKLWMGLIEVGPIAVWLLYKTISNNSSSNHLLNFETAQWIYLGIAVVTIATILYVALTRKEAGGGSRVFLMTSTTGIIVLIIAAYVFQVWWKANMFSTAIILFPSITIILMINAFIEPKMPFLYASIYLSMMTSLAFYALLLWIMEDVTTGGIKLPFHLDEFIFVPAIISSVSIEIIVISSYWWTISRISKYSSRSNKAFINQTKGVNHE